MYELALIVSVSVLAGYGIGCIAGSSYIRPQPNKRRDAKKTREVLKDALHQPGDTIVLNKKFWGNYSKTFNPQLKGVVMEITTVYVEDLYNDPDIYISIILPDGTTINIVQEEADKV